MKLDYVFHHRALPAVYAQYAQQPTAAYVAHNGMLIPAQSAQPQTPLIDYTGAYVAQLAGGAFAATDVAAAAGTGRLLYHSCTHFFVHKSLSSRSRSPSFFLVLSSLFFKLLLILCIVDLVGHCTFSLRLNDIGSIGVA